MRFNIRRSLYLRGLFTLAGIIIGINLFDHIDHNLMASLCHNWLWCFNLHLLNLIFILKPCLRIKLVTTVCFHQIASFFRAFMMLFSRRLLLFTFSSDEWFKALAAVFIIITFINTTAYLNNRWTHAFNNSFKFIIYSPDLAWIAYCLKKHS